MKYFVLAIVFMSIVLLIQLFMNRRLNPSILNANLLEAGQLLFPDHKTDFENFFNVFLGDKNDFLSRNRELLNDYDYFELDKLTAIKVIYIFGDSRQQLLTTDWRGEENEREIEDFLENKLQVNADWIHVDNVRKDVVEETQRDGKFIIDLLKAMDKDLGKIQKRLIFLDLGWDAYVYTVVDLDTHKMINEKFGRLFFGVEKLRK